MPTMTSGNIVFEKTGQAPSPSKDFHQLLITESDVVWRSWRISLRKEQGNVAPSQIKQSHKDFFFDEVVSADIKRIFGEDILRYVECIVNKDWFMRMKDEVLINIFSYLNLNDIGKIAQVCRHFRALCNSNHLWKVIYEKSCPSVSESILDLGNDVGWKKLYFTNKLQQQKQASRLRRSAGANKTSVEIKNAASLVASY